MSAQKCSPRLVLTIDVNDSAAAVDQRAAAQCAAALLGQLAAHRLVATWSADDPAGSPTITLVRDAGGAHEIALLGPAGAFSPRAPRGLMLAAMRAPLSRAEAAGLAIRTLSLDQSELPANLDLLARYGITTVRWQPEAAIRHTQSLATRLVRWLHGGRSSAPEPLQRLRWGLWAAASTATLPDDPPRAWERKLTRAATAGTTVILRIDLARLAAAGAAGLKRSARLLEHARHLNQVAGLSTLTLAAATAERMPEQCAATRSILHRRAA